MTYQDVWLNGKCIRRGERECASRYELIRAFCARFVGPFTVCDIGANMCYFGIRLAEDFPLCQVTAFEFDHFKLREDHLRANEVQERIVLIRQKLNIADVEKMALERRFDLALALSVMHHLPGNHAQWMRALRGIADNVILEYALGDSSRTALRKGYGIPRWTSLLGYGTSHLNPTIKRPIVLVLGLPRTAPSTTLSLFQ